MNNEFDRPLLVYKEKNKSFHFFRDQAQLGICNYRAIKVGWYDDMVIMSINGESYRILRLNIKKYRIWPIFHWLLASPIVDLEFNFIPTPSIFSFDELKKKLMAFIKQDSYFANTGTSRQVIEKIKAASNYSEIEAAFQFLH